MLIIAFRNKTVLLAGCDPSPNSQGSENSPIDVQDNDERHARELLAKATKKARLTDDSTELDEIEDE